MLEAGAEVNAVNAESFTPLIKAVQGKSMSMVATLLDAGADQAQKDSRGWQVCMDKSLDSRQSRTFVTSPGRPSLMQKP